jgi:hypothetical protein
MVSAATILRWSQRTLAQADNSSNGGGKQQQWQAKTEAAAGADNNQSESGSDRGSRNSDWLR